jgi:hypothetical protein
MGALPRLLASHAVDFRTRTCESNTSALNSRVRLNDDASRDPCGACCPQVFPARQKTFFTPSQTGDAFRHWRTRRSAFNRGFIDGCQTGKTSVPLKRDPICDDTRSRKAGKIFDLKACADRTHGHCSSASVRLGTFRYRCAEFPHSSPRLASGGARDGSDDVRPPGRRRASPRHDGINRSRRGG